MQEHVTIDGDTFDALALRYYYNEQMASAIIQANPDYSDVLIFDAGVRLVIPAMSAVTLPQTLPPWRREA